MAHVIDAIIRLKDDFSATLDTVNGNVNRFAKQQIAMSRQIEQTSRSIGTIGSTLSKAFTVPIVAAGAIAGKAFLDFEDNMAKISTVADVQKVSLETLGKNIISLSNQTGQAVSDIQDGLYDAISSGVDTSKVMSFMAVAVKAAKGGFTDTKTSVDGLTTTLNAYGLTADKVTGISNQMMVAQNLGKTTFGEMAQSIGNVVPTAAALGIKTQELFGSLAALTANGIKTSEAVTGLKAAFSNVVKPSDEASKMAQKIGLTFNAAHLQSVGWSNFLDEVRAKTGGSTDKMAQLFGSVEALNSVLTLTSKQGSDLFNQSIQQMSSGTDYISDAFNKVSNTPAEKFRRSLNDLKNVGISFGQQLSPMIDQVSSSIQRLTDQISKLTPEQQQMIMKVLMTIAVVGPTLLAISKTMNGIKDLQRGFGDLTKSISGAGGMLAWLKTPSGIVTIAIMGIALLAYVLIRYWTPISSFFKKISDDVGTAINIVSQKFQDFKNSVLELKDKAINDAKKAFDDVGATAKVVGQKFQDFKDKVLDLKDKAIKDTKKLFEDFTQTLKDHESQIKTTAIVLGVIFGPALIKTGTQAAISAGQIAAYFIAGVVKTGIEATISAAKITASFTVSMAKAGLEAGINSAKITGSFIASMVKAGFEAIINAAKITGSFIASIIKSGAEAVIAGAKITVSFIGSLIKTAAQAAITGAAITISLIGSLIAYAAQGWKTAAAITAQGVVWLAQKAYILASAAATGIMTAAQWALNSALLASPITWVVLGIAALVLAVVGLYEAWVHNWGGIQDKTKVVVDEVMKIWQGLKDFFAHPIQGTINIIKNIAGGTSDAGAGHNALGTSYWGGGQTWVGENGPELIKLPKGTQISDNRTSNKTSKSILIPKLADTIIVREEGDIDKIANALVRKLNEAAINTA